MCDCYGHKCLLCDERVPIHLGDFNTRREEINVICHKHSYSEVEPYLKDAVLWVMDVWPSGHLWDDDEEDGGYNFKRSKQQAEEYGGKVITVQALTDNALKNARHNHPNIMIGFAPLFTSWFKEN